MARLLSMITVALLLLACNDHATIAGRTDDDLLYKTWVLSRIKGRPVPVGVKDAATLRFTADHRIEGTSSCNRVSSPESWWNILGYEFHWGWLTPEYRWSVDSSGAAGGFEPARLAITAAGCGEGQVVQSGDAFWTAMQRARRWAIHNRNLVIAFADGGNAILIPRLSQASDEQ